MMGIFIFALLSKYEDKTLMEDKMGRVIISYK
jgi:hypothetical protein